VVVVCNGCRDDTAEIARKFAPSVRVIDSPIASKPAALNLGDESARGFPRFFLDADIVLPLADVRKVAQVLRDGKTHAAAPRMKVDLEARGWAIRAFYSVWLRTPYVTEDMIGCGVYAISGAFDLLVFVEGETTEVIDRVLDAIGALPGVDKTQSSLVLSVKFDRS